MSRWCKPDKVSRLVVLGTVNYSSAPYLVHGRTIRMIIQLIKDYSTPARELRVATILLFTGFKQLCLLCLCIPSIFIQARNLQGFSTYYRMYKQEYSWGTELLMLEADLYFACQLHLFHFVAFIVETPLKRRVFLLSLIHSSTRVHSTSRHARRYLNYECHITCLDIHFM